MKSNLLKTQNHYFLFFCCATLLVGLSWLPYLQIMFHSASYGDEGFVAQSAYRIFNGEIPYRDFFNPITPGAYYLVSFFMDLFGPTFLAVRLSLLITNTLLVLVCCLIAYQYKIRSISIYVIILSFLAYFGGPYWFIASHHWTALTLCLVSFSLLVHAVDNETKPHYLLLSGIFAALCAFTMQHLGAVWIITATLGLLLSQNHKRLKTVLFFWGGVIAFSLPVAIAFISVVGIDVLIYDLITFPLTRYHNLQGHQGISIKYLGQMWEGLLATLQYGNSLEGYSRIAARGFGLVGIIVVYALPYLGVGALAFLWKTGTRNKQLLALLTAFFCSQYLTAFSRLSDTTLVFAAPGALIVLAVAIEKLNQRENVWRVPAGLFEKAWIFLFAGVAISGCLFHTVVQKAVTVTPAGPVYSLYTGEQQTLQGLNHFLSSKPSNDTVFVYPYAPMLYFLYHISNPAPYDTLTYPMHTQVQLDNVQKIIDTTRCRWIVTTAQIGNDSFGRYLSTNYAVDKRLKYVTVLKRNDSELSTDQSTGHTEDK